MTFTKEDTLPAFRTGRYALLNKCRWDHFLRMGLSVQGKTVFEPGAGVGDQTEWLLKQDPRQIFVNDGRKKNLEIVHERFGNDPRVSYHEGDLETCLPSFTFHVDFIYCYGVYYHVHETLPEFHIMREFARIKDAEIAEHLALRGEECGVATLSPRK